ncbi:hypothetical protein [Natrarchaeobaculum aegyptiacum]|nr:hypothetical protein [Natrarchaeobaculum aegyptiacum]
MTPDRPFIDCARGVDSIHSGILLFGYSILLSLFMAGVMFLNG